MQARKGNKVYQVDEQHADAYAHQGFDIYDSGKLVKHAYGKTVPIEQYEQLQAKCDKLQAELDALSGKSAKKSARPTKAELIEEAESLGIDVPEGATNPEIYELIQAAK